MGHLRITSFILIIFLLYPLFNGAQNLIPNPSFEEYLSLPNAMGQWSSMKEWDNLNMNTGWPNGSPDYYHINGSGFAKIPVNGNMGEIYAYDGEAISAIMVWSRADLNFREYLSIKLSHALEVGRSYKFSFQVSNGRKDNGQQGGYGIDSLGIVFSENALVQNQAEVVKVDDVIYINEVLYNEDWTLLEFEIVAVKPNKFMTIGNFRDDAHTNAYGFSPYGNEAYYFLDDMALELIEEDYYIEGINRVCQNQPFQLIAYGLYEVRWVDSLDPSTVLAYGDTLNYSTNTSATYVAIGKYNRTSHHVKVDQIPVIELGADTMICAGEEINLNVSPDPGNIIWSDGDTTYKKTISEAGNYWVKIENYCGIFSDSLIVQTDACVCELYIPNSFTPNSDNVNDVFKVISNCEIDTYEISIFSRWGELVFSSDDPLISWDGRCRTRVSISETFMYKITYQFRDGLNQYEMGSIRLVK